MLTDRNWPVDTQVRSLYRDIPPHTVRKYHITQTELDPSWDRDHEELTQIPVLTDPLGLGHILSLPLSPGLTLCVIPITYNVDPEPVQVLGSQVDL